MKKVIDIHKFITLLKEKATKDKINLEKSYDKIKKFKQMDKDSFIYALQDVNKFKSEFLYPYYKLPTLLQDLNNEIDKIRKEKLTEEQLNQKIEELKKMRKKIANSKMELFFCNASDNRKLITLANIFMTYGLIHVGIMLDDVVLNWGRGIFGNSVVVPWYDVFYDDYIFALELINKDIINLIKETFDNLRDYLTNKKSFENMGTKKALVLVENQLNIIAEESVRYNVDKDYSLLFQNCQHFVNNITKKLGINVDMSGEVGKVLKIAREELHKFDFNFRGVAIKKREDLDNFLKNDIKIYTKDELRVLLCFRNTYDYWARVHPNDSKYKTTEFFKNLWDDLEEKEKFD